MLKSIFSIFILIFTINCFGQVNEDIESLENFLRDENLKGMVFNVFGESFTGDQAGLFIDRIIDSTIRIPVHHWRHEEILRFHDSDTVFSSIVDAVDEVPTTKDGFFSRKADSIERQINTLVYPAKKRAAEWYFYSHFKTCSDSTVRAWILNRSQSRNSIRSILRRYESGSISLKQIAELSEVNGDFTNKEDLRDGLFFYLTAWELYDSISDFEDAGRLQNKIASVYMHRDDFVDNEKKAGEHFNNARNYFLLANDTLNSTIADLEIASLCVNITYNLDPSYSDLVDQYTKSGLSKLNLRHLYDDAVADKKSLRSYLTLDRVKDVPQVFNQYKSSARLRYLYCLVLGKYFQQKGEAEVAEKYFQCAVILSATTEYPNGASEFYDGLSYLQWFYAQHKSRNKVLEYGRKILAFCRSQNDGYLVTWQLTNLAFYLIDMKEEQLAKSMLEEASTFHKELNDEFPGEMDDYYQEFYYLSRYKLSKNLKLKDSAYYLGLYETIRANFIGKAGELNRLEGEFLEGKYNREIEIKKHELQGLSNALANAIAARKTAINYGIATLVAIVMSAIGYSIWRARAEQQRIKNTRDQLTDLARAKIHNIGSKYNKIHFLAIAENRRHAIVRSDLSDYVAGNITYLKELLVSWKKRPWTLNDEFHLLETFYLSEIGTNPETIGRRTVEISYVVSKDIEKDRVLFMQEVFSTLLDNSMSYAFPKKEDPCVFKVAIERQGNVLAVEISDNGEGKSPEKYFTRNPDDGLNILESRIANAFALAKIKVNKEKLVTVVAGKEIGTTIKFLYPYAEI